MLQKKNEYTHELEKDLFEGCSNYVVRKDEIREKIKELEQELEDKNENGLDCTLMYEHEIDINGIIEVLQELLKEE